MDEQTSKDIDEMTPITQGQVEAGSALDRIKQIREEFQADNEVALDLPGYRGELLARYRPLPWEIIRGIANRVERNRRAPDIEVTVASDGLLNACFGFYFRGDDGERVALKYNGEEITGYNSRLVAALDLTDRNGIKPETPREIVKSMFPDDMALVSHYGSFMDWQAERDEEDEERVQGAASSDDAVHPTSR